MFKGEKGRMKPESPDRLNRLVSGTTVSGDLNATSSLRIDGEVVGNVNCNGKLVLGQEGVVRGDINATEVELDGRVEGYIKAEELLILHQTASVKGDIDTGRIIIEDGAQVEGNIQTGDVSKKSKRLIEKKKNKVSEEKLEVSEVVY